MLEYERKFKSFIEYTDVGIFSFTKDHAYNEINSKFCGMIGYDRHELCSYKFPEPFFPSQFYLHKEEQFEQYKQTGLLHIETFFCKKNNTYFPVSLTGSIIPSSEDNETEFVILVRDISEQKKAEREFKLSQDMLISLNNKLENLVKKRTRQLQQVMKQKNEFINQLGHDLKNPLGPMLNLLPIIEKKSMNDECRKIISVIHRNAIFMRDLITDTIELAKLDSPNIPFSFEPVILNQEIDSIIENNFTIHNQKNITIINDVPSDIEIEMDKIRLHELIVNLVGNSIKYGKDNGSIVISAEPKNDTSLQLSVIDDGIGMTQEQVDKVFDEFYRVNQKNSTFKSSGLGMSICKKIVERHGGSIHCESEGVGKGTTFRCILPLKHHGLEDEMINQKMYNKLEKLNKIN